jgi:hypothetical protein
MAAFSDYRRRFARAFSPRRLFLDWNRDWRRAVVLAGSGRSGTTWIGNLINHDNAYRVIFEPLHIAKVPAVAHFRTRQYLPLDSRDPVFLDSMRAILSGRIRDPWADQFNRKRVVSRRLVKMIRANFLLRWMHECFPGVPIVLLVRHPVPVALSCVRQGWKGRQIDDILAQPALMAEFFEPFRPLMEITHDPFEWFVLLWCLETYVPFRQFRSGEIHVLFYEHVWLNPADELPRLFHFIGRSYSRDVLRHVERPSPLADQNSAIRTGRDVIGAWRQQATAQQVQSARRILERFELGELYGPDGLPNAAAAGELLRRC